MFTLLINTLRNLFRPALPPAPPIPTPRVIQTPTPTPKPIPPTPPAPPVCPPALASRIDKTISRLVDLDRLYGLNQFADVSHVNKWRHDMKVMAAHKDLQQVRMELLDAQKRIAVTVAVPFDGANHHREIDDLVTPVIHRQSIRSARILVTFNKTSRDDYKHLLQLNWNTAERLEELPGDSIHAGDGLPGKFTIRAQDRYLLTVQTAFWDRGYAFAFTPDLPSASLYMHAEHCPDGFRPLPGEQFTALIVQTERGLQARAVRPR